MRTGEASLTFALWGFLVAVATGIVLTLINQPPNFTLSRHRASGRIRYAERHRQPVFDGSLSPLAGCPDSAGAVHAADLGGLGQLRPVAHPALAFAACRSRHRRR